MTDGVMAGTRVERSESAHSYPRTKINLRHRYGLAEQVALLQPYLPLRLQVQLPKKRISTFIPAYKDKPPTPLRPGRTSRTPTTISTTQTSSPTPKEANQHI
eukprot:581326_1